MMAEFIIALLGVICGLGVVTAFYAICGVYYYKVIKHSKKTISQILSEL